MTMWNDTYMLPICEAWCWYMYMTGWFCLGKCWCAYSSTMVRICSIYGLCIDFFPEILYGPWVIHGSTMGSVPRSCSIPDPKSTVEVAPTFKKQFQKAGSDVCRSIFHWPKNDASDVCVDQFKITWFTHIHTYLHIFTWFGTQIFCVHSVGNGHHPNWLSLHRFSDG